jgi:hypothetical protein
MHVRDAFLAALMLAGTIETADDDEESEPSAAASRNGAWPALRCRQSLTSGTQFNAGISYAATRAVGKSTRGASQPTSGIWAAPPDPQAFTLTRSNRGNFQHFAASGNTWPEACI